MSRPAGREAPVSEEEEDPPPQLSPTQIIVGALTAVTTTLLLSMLGTAGTVLGAALGSTLSVLGTYFYSQSIHRTKKIYHKLPEYGVPLPGAYAVTAEEDQPTATTTRVADSDDTALDHAGMSPDQTQVVPAEESESTGSREHTEATRPTRKRLVIWIVALFAAILLTVTALELALGRPLSSMLDDEPATGTTIFGESNQATPTPTLTSTVTVTTGATPPTVAPTTEAPTSPPVTPTTEPPPTPTPTETEPATEEPPGETGAVGTATPTTPPTPPTP